MIMTFRTCFAALVGAAFCFLALSPIAASDLTSSEQFEARFERAFGHEIRVGILHREPDRVEESIDIEAEFLADVGLEYTVLDRPLAFRPLVGISVNTEGFTNFGYAQLVASYGLTDRLFIEGALGATVHDGEVQGVSQTRLNLGCRILFRESANIGVRVTQNINILGGVTHASNGGLCDQNAGVTNFGGRLGVRF